MAFPICSASSRATCERSRASSATFIRIESATSASRVGGQLLFTPKERIKKFGLANIVSQFAVLEEDVHRFPERVVKHLDQFLLNK